MLLDARYYASKKVKDLAKRVSKLEVKPFLVIVRVGEDPASERYVNNKVKRCHEVGIGTKVYHLPGNVQQDEVAEIIYNLNNNSKVTGILLQLPLPKHLDEHLLVNLINPDKDVDGLTTQNMGRLAEGMKSILPCTPRGIIDFLEFNNIDIESKDVLIISRSNIVGKPLIFMFLNKNATVTVAHSRTADIKDKIRKADIIVTAVGKPNFINKTFLKELEEAKQYKVIVDVSINFVDGKMCGDVFKDNNFLHSLDYLQITPVPNGVGQCTVISLLENVVELAEEENN